MSLPGQRQAGRDCSGRQCKAHDVAAKLTPAEHRLYCPPGTAGAGHPTRGGASTSGRGLYLGGGTLYSAARIPTLGAEPLSRLLDAGTQPKSAAATADPEAGAGNPTAPVEHQNPTLERAHDPAESPHVQVRSGGGAWAGCVVCSAG